MSENSNKDSQAGELSPDEARMLIKAIEEIEKEEVDELVRSRQNPPSESE